MVWSYDNDYTGQEEWGTLSPAFAKCRIGTKQSPIHITYTQKMLLPELKFFYKSTDATVENVGYTLRISFPEKSQIMQQEGKRYWLERIEFHTPGEHIIKQKFFALEVQLMHQSEDGDKRILAVMAEMGGDKKALPDFDAVLNNNLTETGNKKTIRLNPELFLPVYRGYYRYEGSLTIPPCREDITWHVLKSPIDVSRKQIKALAQYTERNARLTQPVYMRKIQESAHTWEMQEKAAISAP